MTTRQELWMLLGIVTCVWIKFITSSAEIDGTLMFSPEQSVSLMQNWTILANATFDASREGRVFLALSKVSGIYRNRAKAIRIGVETSVLVSVVSITEGRNGALYRQLLRNWLCYTAHYDFMPVVYYLAPDSSSSFESYFNELRELNRNAIFVDYPTHLFWSLMTQMTSWTTLLKARHSVDYQGDYPSFAHYGALVMLVPLLEVLSLGFGAVYLDIDIALVKDPIPFMTLGNSDLSVSPEVRICKYLTQMQDSRKVSADWGAVEPNTGTMLVRATGQGPRLMRSFLLRLVNEAKSNDQPYLNDKLGHVEYSTDCQYDYSRSYEENIMAGRLVDVNSDRRNDSSSLSGGVNVTAFICILPEILFQNGYMAFTCGQKEKLKTEYLLRMNRLARVGSAAGTTSRRIHWAGDGGNSSSRSDVADSSTSRDTAHGEGHKLRKRGRGTGRKDSGDDHDFVAPLTVHANYCGTKRRCLGERGLWLLEEVSQTSQPPGPKFVCNAFNKADTKFGKPNFAYELEGGEHQLRGYLDTLDVGAVVRFGRYPEVFIVDYPSEEGPGPGSPNDGLKVLRAVPNLVTLDNLGFPSPLSLSNPYTDVMVLGRGILDLTNSSIAHPQVKDAVSFAQIYREYKVYEQAERAKSGLQAATKAADENDNSSLSHSNAISRLTEYQKYWEQKVRLNGPTDSRVNRTQNIDHNIMVAKGVYRDSMKSESLGVQNTVLLCVLSYDDVMSLENFEKSKDSRGVATFGSNLKIFMLSTEEYGLKPLLYLTPSERDLGIDGKTVHDNVHRVLSALVGSDRRDPGPLFELAHSYPTSLFFSFLSALPSWLDRLDSRDTCSFSGDAPTVTRFGLMTALVPMLELLSKGVDVIYMDFGVKMLRDPIPYLTANHNYKCGSMVPLESLPDISIAKVPLGHKGTCKFRYYDFDTDSAATEAPVAETLLLDGNTSSVLDINLGASATPDRKNEAIQPNFLLMRFLSTDNSVSFLKKWIADIAVSGDRKGWGPFSAGLLNFTESNNCNGNFLVAPELSLALGRGRGGAPTYCYYNGLSFLAHEVLLKCHPKYSSTPIKAAQRFESPPSALAALVKEDQLRSEGGKNQIVAVLVHADPYAASFFNSGGKTEYFLEL